LKCKDDNKITISTNRERRDYFLDKARGYWW